MQITIFGANGKVGRLLVAGALMRGYSVTAFVHSSSRLPEHKNLTVFQGDVYSSADVNKAIKGSDAVISALGSWGTPKKDILSAGMKNIIPAMQQAKITRIVSLTGGGANAPGDKLTANDKIGHSLMKLAAARVLCDGEQHINLLSHSSLNWTVLRSPVMTKLGNPTAYKLVAKRPSLFATIHRHAVVKAMLDQLDSISHTRQAPYIIR